MAHSTISLPSQSGKTALAAQSAARRTSAPKTQASFASVMAREEKGQAQVNNLQNTARQAASKIDYPARQSRPVVARLPENNTGLPLRNTVLAGRTPNDLVRMQALNEAFAQRSGTGSGMAGTLASSSNLRTIAAGGNGKGFALTSGDFIHTSRTAKTGTARNSRKRAKTTDSGIGKLSAKFESGTDGIAAIGYDSTGGTSYGKYQIASKVGSMKSFLNFLDGEAPDLAKRLRQAGPANTGSRQGNMPNVWRAIAKEQPERFEKLQEAYIHETHYRPALAAIGEKTGVDPDSLSTAMREVIWSTAVQHGPAGASRIFVQADSMSGKPQSADYERKMINNVYNVRSGQFGSSTPQVRNAVRNRFREERQLALKMLDGPSRMNMA